MPKGAVGKLRKGLNMSNPKKYGSDNGKGSEMKKADKKAAAKK